MAQHTCIRLSVEKTNAELMPKDQMNVCFPVVSCSGLRFIQLRTAGQHFVTMGTGVPVGSTSLWVPFLPGSPGLLGLTSVHSLSPKQKAKGLEGSWTFPKQRGSRCPHAFLAFKSFTILSLRQPGRSPVHHGSRLCLTTGMEERCGRELPRERFYHQEAMIFKDKMPVLTGLNYDSKQE